MIELSPIGVVRNDRRVVEDDHWGGVVSVIELTDSFAEDALLQIEEFSHAEVIFYFHLVEDAKIENGARHPRNNKDWPKVGIFAQRGKNRPNRLGASMVKIIKREGTLLFVQGLDAVDGTPVLDIKPVMREFLPQGEVIQPEWAAELMKNYWHEFTPPDKSAFAAQPSLRAFKTVCRRVFRNTDPSYFPQIQYRGRTIYFCTESCLNAFLADPEPFYKAHSNSANRQGKKEE